MISVTVVTPPAKEPLELEAVKNHLRVDVEDDDALIASLIVAARQKLEHDTWRSLITQTLRLSLDRFPGGRAPIVLPQPPLQSVATVEYVDEAGDDQTMAASLYKVDADAEPGRIGLRDEQTWPDIIGEVADVKVTYVAGYGATAEAVPEHLRAALQLLVAHWYEHREAVVVGGAVPQVVPLAYESIVLQNRVWSFL